MSATKHYTIFLLKERLTAREFVDDEKHTGAILLQDQDDWEGVLYLASQRTGTPEWIQEISPLLTSPIRGVSAGISGALLIEVEGRTFAVTFGHGRSLLKPKAIVRGFGLRVTVNRVHPDKLRTI